MKGGREGGREGEGVVHSNFEETLVWPPTCSDIALYKVSGYTAA